MHAMVYSRPDIAYAVSVLATKVENPTEADCKAAIRVLTYLNSTKNLTIEYGGQEKLEVYVDADDDAATRFPLDRGKFTTAGELLVDQAYLRIACRASFDISSSKIS